MIEQWILSGGSTLIFLDPYAETEIGLNPGMPPLNPSSDLKKLIDVCAAPAGKSILLHSLGFNVYAIDKSQSQINKFHENINRLNIKLDIQKMDFLKKKFTDKYNSILLDAPCSALGTFRRNPDVTIKIDQSHIKNTKKYNWQW